MTRLIDADALFTNLDGMMAVSPTGYIHGDTVADMISDAPTVNAIPVEYIEKEIKRMEDGIEHALIKYKHADGTIERMIARKASLEFVLAKWRAERKEE